MCPTRFAHPPPATQPLHEATPPPQPAKRGADASGEPQHRALAWPHCGQYWWLPNGPWEPSPSLPPAAWFKRAAPRSSHLQDPLAVPCSQSLLGATSAFSSQRLVCSFCSQALSLQRCWSFFKCISCSFDPYFASLGVTGHDGVRIPDPSPSSLVCVEPQRALSTAWVSLGQGFLEKGFCPKKKYKSPHFSLT